MYLSSTFNPHGSLQRTKFKSLTVSYKRDQPHEQVGVKSYFQDCWIFFFRNKLFNLYKLDGRVEDAYNVVSK